MANDTRAWSLTGPDARTALDWLHVHASLAGVLEQEDGIVVWLPGLLPALPASPALQVTVRELVVPDGPAPTGLEHDRAILLAGDLLVRPPWVDRPRDFAGVELVVPRGGAFGSGEHASTQAALLCLHAMWDAPSSFADVGCGSGILALYAQVRGCPAIQACDVDAPSVEAAAALLPSARVRLGGPEVLQPADCVVANMTAAELHATLAAILARWTRRGPLVLSGMRRGELVGIEARLPVPVTRRVDRAPFYALGVVVGGAR